MITKAKKDPTFTYTNFKTDNATALKITLLRKFLNTTTSALMFNLVRDKFEEHRSEIERAFSMLVPDDQNHE